MQADKELLELAAKAAGIEIEYFYGDGDELWAKHEPRMTDAPGWNPLTDDGDALRLAVKLKMNIYTGFSKMIAELPSDGDAPSIQMSELRSGDPYAATRRAIVRAAAAIGEQMT